MKKTTLIFAALTVSLVSAIPFNALAAESPIESGLYYELGAGHVSSGALNPNAANATLNVGVRLPSACGIWEDRHQLDKVFGDLVEFYLEEQLDVDGLTEEIITGIKVMPQVLLIAALQRALPGFYDYSQNLKAQLDFKIDNAQLSCQAVVDKAERGAHPLDGWVKMAGSVAWRQTLAEDYNVTRGTHLLAVEDQVTSDTVNTPIPWFGGPKGATNETKIAFVNDVVSAGYAALAGAEAGSTYDGTTVITAPETITYPGLDANATSINDTNQVDTRLGELFPTSKDAADFAIDVLGEELVAYCDECDTQFKPGRGLSPSYEEAFSEIITGWADLIKQHSGETRPTIGEFDVVSSRKVRITKSVFEAVIKRQGADRVIIVERLASDVAAEKTIDKALALRQLLRAGSNTPQVLGLDIAADKARELHDELRAEVDDLRWEIQQQNHGVGSTAASILAADVLDGLTRDGGSMGVATPTGGARREGDRVVPR